MKLSWISRSIGRAVLALGLLGGASIISAQTNNPRPYENQSGYNQGYTDRTNMDYSNRGGSGWGWLGLLGLLGLLGARRSREVRTTYDTRGTTYEPRTSH